MEELKAKLKLENYILDKFEFPYLIKESIFKNRVNLDKLVDICKEKPKILDICPESIIGFDNLCKEAILKMGFSESNLEKFKENYCKLMKLLIEIVNKTNVYNKTVREKEIDLDKKSIVNLIVSYKWSFLFKNQKDKNELIEFLLSESDFDKDINKNSNKLLQLSNLYIDQLVAEANRQPIPEKTTSLDEIDKFLKTHYLPEYTKTAFANELFNDLVNLYIAVNMEMDNLSQDDLKIRQIAIEKQERLIEHILVNGGDIELIMKNCVQMNMINLLYKLSFNNVLAGYALYHGFKMNRNDVINMIIENIIDYTKFKIENLDDIFDFINKYINVGYLTEYRDKLYKSFIIHVLKKSKNTELITKILELLNSGDLWEIDFLSFDIKTLDKLYDIIVNKKLTNLINSLPKIGNSYLILIDKIIKYVTFEIWEDIDEGELIRYISSYLFKRKLTEKDYSFITYLLVETINNNKYDISRELIINLDKLQINPNIVKSIYKNKDSKFVNKLGEEIVYNNATNLLKILINDLKVERTLDFVNLTKIAIKNDIRNSLNLLTPKLKRGELEKAQDKS